VNNLRDCGIRQKAYIPSTKPNVGGLDQLGDIPTIHWRLLVFRAILADSDKTGSILRLLMLLLAIATRLFCSRCEFLGGNEMKTDEACHAQGAGC
jgi:hypothetical protein